jgi:hypothetical protein
MLTWKYSKTYCSALLMKLKIHNRNANRMGDGKKEKRNMTGKVLSHFKSSPSVPSL